VNPEIHIHKSDAQLQLYEVYRSIKYKEKNCNPMQLYEILSIEKGCNPIQREKDFHTVVRHLL